MIDQEASRKMRPSLHVGAVIANTPLCREHYRLVIGIVNLAGAQPGQFVHLCPANRAQMRCDATQENAWSGTSWSPVPLLRRAFSIAGLRDQAQGAKEIDVIYRVVGTATRWMESLRAGDAISIMGPLGNTFPIRETKRRAWMACGGVGLPPMLWLAKALRDRGRESVALVGARSRELLALEIDEAVHVANDARRASFCAAEFTAVDTPTVISTDDGSLGFGGFVPQALEAFHDGAGVSSDDLVVYTCGPEPMMNAVARFCLDREIECYACVEREMACGTGTCQSCVVPIRDVRAADGWRYALCCTDGPVFDVSRVIWP